MADEKAEKKGIAEWLACSPEFRARQLKLLRCSFASRPVADTLADALEELSELHEKSAEELRRLLAGFVGQKNTPAARVDIAAALHKHHVAHCGELLAGFVPQDARADIVAALHGYFSGAMHPDESRRETKRDEAKRDLAAAKEPTCPRDACILLKKK